MRYRGRHRRHRRPSTLVAAPAVALALLLLADDVVTEAARGQASPVPRPALSVTGPESANSAGPQGLAPPPPLPPPPREFDIVASGDILIHSSLWRQALENSGGGGYDFRPMFAHVRPVLRGAGLALCHLETPLTDGPPASYPVFSTPTELARAIAWAGWDACSIASNHSLDRGQAGIESTADALDAVGVGHTGAYRTKRESTRSLMLEAEGVRVALLAYTHWTNGFPLPEPWSVNLISLPKIEADARRARRRGADLVIATFHWGDEYRHEPNAEQTEVARALLQRGVVDLVLGQHAHVVQPIERIGGRFVVYGEGNLISGMTQPERRDGLIAVAHVRADARGVRITGVDYIPTWVRFPEYVVEPVGRRLDRLVARGEGGSPLAAELRASYVRTVSVVGERRRIHPIPAALP